MGVLHLWDLLAPTGASLATFQPTFPARTQRSSLRPVCTPTRLASGHECPGRQAGGCGCVAVPGRVSSFEVLTPP
jgi:hypothetical protein